MDSSFIAAQQCLESRLDLPVSAPLLESKYLDLNMQAWGCQNETKQVVK
jgi:hypothetical protein